jgi:SagB-type dehydrogenase family enzyme
LRAAPSAGALYPTEISVATRGVPGLVDGVHDYQVKDHSLVTMWEGDFGRTSVATLTVTRRSIDASRVLVLFSGVFERSAWRYHRARLPSRVARHGTRSSGT